MRSLRRRGAIALAALSLVAASPAASVHAEAGSPQAVAAHTCGSGYTHASLSWGHKCLRAGQFCKRGRSANREYHRYGFHCRTNGHLTYH
jgi:hypothetical protein